VYGVNRGLVEVPKGSKFVDLTFEAEKLPQFKEYFSKVEELEKLKRKDVIHPVTKKTVKFSQLMGEVYKEGAGYTKSYERFPYDIDHKLGVMADPFKDLRIISQRLNVGGGQANFRNPQLLKKMGYKFDKDINQLFNDELKLAEDVLVKGRRLRSSYGVAQDFAEKGRQAASAYVPETITNKISKIKPGSGFENLFGIIKQNVISRAINNDDNICEVVFGAKRLANGGPAGGGCAKQMEFEFDKAPEQTLNKISQSTNPTLKGFAQRSLSLFPKLGTVGKIGTVAAGAGIALSGLRFNPEKGEIVTTDNDQKADQNQILQYVKDNPLKVTAGSSLGFAAQEVPGAYKAARDLGRGRVRSTLGISGAIRPVLTTFGTPLLTGLYEGAIGAKRLEEGETMTDILTDPVGPALGLTLMEPLSKLSGVVKDAPKRTMLEGARNYFNLSNVGQARPGLTGQILRMGLSPRMIAGASRFLGLPGIALGAGLAGYDAYKNYQNQEGMIYNLFNRDE